MQKTHELRPYVVLVGPVGVGKSTLAQKLMVRRRREGAGTQGFGWSATKKSTKYSATMFDFADTPGLKSRKEKVDHAVNIVLALTERPVSRIFVLVKYSERLDDFCNEAELVVRPFHPWKDLMTVIVTHWEKSDQTENCKKAIEQALKEELDITSVLCTTKETTGAELDCSMEALLVARPRFVVIGFDHILAYFDLKKNDLRMIDYIKKKNSLYTTLVTKCMTKADSFEADNSTVEQTFASLFTFGLERPKPKEKKRDDFLFYSQIALKGIIDQWKNEFIKEFLDDVSEPEDFASLDALNNSLRDTFRGYRAYCLQFWNYNEGTDSFRKCPYCGEVWIKVEGCNGSTVCGARPGNGDRPVKTIWTWKLTDDDILFSFQVVNFSNLLGLNPNRSGAGCGQSISWKDMQPVQVDSALFEAPLSYKEATDVATASTKITEKFEQKVHEKFRSFKMIDKTETSDSNLPPSFQFSSLRFQPK